MHLIEVLLPLADNQGRKFSDETLRSIQGELSDKFGGLTAHSRAPAKGVWVQGRQKQQDDIVLVEVMANDLDAHWWQGFRRRVETLLRQDEIVIRAHEMRKL
jgi:hypothetical protein